MPGKISMWAEVTTFHGVPEVQISASRKNHCRFIFWLIVVLLMVVVLGWQTYMLVSSYSSGDGYTTSMSVAEVDDGLAIPEVVICNYNRVDSVKAKSYGMSPDVLSYFFGGFLTNYVFITPPSKYEGQNKTYADFLAKNRNLTDSNKVMDALAHSCSDMITTCMTGQTGWNDNCCANSYTVHNIYGSCFAVNKSVMQLFPGPSNGLRILVNPNLDRYMSGWVWNNYLDEGIVVIIGNYPYYTYPSNPVHVMPGVHAMIELYRTRHTFTQPDYQVFNYPCVYNKTLQTLQGQYSKDACRVDCLNYYIIKLCNCSLMGVDPKTSGTKVCAPGSIKCARDLYDGTSNDTAIKAAYMSMRSCQIDCQSTCDTTEEVTTSISLATYPSAQATANYTQLVKNITNSSGFNTTTSSILLDIFYPWMRRTMIETKETTSIFTLVASIGGHLGLWIGASVITAVQAIYYLLAGCFAAFGNHNAQKSPKIANIVPTLTS